MQESEAVAKVLASGYMLDAKAFDLIVGLPPGTDVDGLVEKLLEQKASIPGDAKVITESDVIGLMPRQAPENQEAPGLRDEADLVVISDPTPAIAPQQGTKGFEGLFRDR